MKQRIAVAAAVLMLIAAAVLNLTYTDEQKPDVVYEMTNQHIVWELGK